MPIKISETMQQIQEMRQPRREFEGMSLTRIKRILLIKNTRRAIDSVKDDNVRNILETIMELIQ